MPCARRAQTHLAGCLGAAPTLVLVTHHVEEIMPVFTHVLLLKRGRVLAAEKKSAALNNATLSEVFDSRMKLTRSNGRYAMSVSAKASVMV